MLTPYLLITTSVLGVLTLLACWNLFLFRVRTAVRMREEKLPMISVLVPARNEESTINSCIESLLRQKYPDFEVIVLDDQSTDKTGAILARLQADNEKLQVVQGRPLPTGWIGKCYACHQLSEHARGDWMLFTDADTVHDPNALRDALELAVSRNADLLTVIPRQMMGSFGEKLVLPLLYFTTFALVPLYALEHFWHPIFAVGIGQFMFFRAAAYHAIGGHAGVKDNIVEDVWLARNIKRLGLHLVVADGRSMVSCRMYTRFMEVWRGFSKNIFAGFNFSFPPMLVVMILYAMLFVLPFGLFIQGLLLGDLGRIQAMLLASQIVMNYAIRILLSFRFRLGILSTLLHPLGILTVIAIAINSWRWIAFGSGARWKGRVYRPAQRQ
jgi:chlorobactene glucosyltransferase